MIIAVEGCDGAGKYTQAKRLAQAIGGVLLSFPNYETETGKAILDNLQQRWSAVGPGRDFDRVNALALQSLFAVNRYEVAARIEKYVLSDQHVVLDRYWLSGVVYGSCDGLDPKWLEQIHACLPQPDAWILIDVPPEESVRRRPERRDRYERDENMEKRREIYRSFFRSRGSDTTPVLVDQDECEYVCKWRVVDGVGTEEEVFSRIRRELQEFGSGQPFIEGV